MGGHMGNAHFGEPSLNSPMVLSVRQNKDFCYIALQGCLKCSEQGKNGNSFLWNSPVFGQPNFYLPCLLYRLF